MKAGKRGIGTLEIGRIAKPGEPVSDYECHYRETGGRQTFDAKFTIQEHLYTDGAIKLVSAALAKLAGDGVGCWRLG